MMVLACLSVIRVCCPCVRAAAGVETVGVVDGVRRRSGEECMKSI